MLRYREVDIHSLGDRGRGLFHTVAIGNCINTVQLLSDLGLDADAKDIKGKSPLHCASREDAYEIMRPLLDNNADASLKDKAGRTASTIAWQEGHKNVMKILEDRHPNELTGMGLCSTYADVGSRSVWTLALQGFTKQSIENHCQATQRDLLPRSGRGKYCSPLCRSLQRTGNRGSAIESQ